jgi:hypothetical protein
VTSGMWPCRHSRTSSLPPRDDQPGIKKKLG